MAITASGKYTCEVKVNTTETSSASCNITVNRRSQYNFFCQTFNRKLLFNNLLSFAGNNGFFSWLFHLD